MYDFMEDYTDTDYFSESDGYKYLSNNEEHREALTKGLENERFNDFVFEVKEVEDKYYLSEKVAKYVLQVVPRHSRPRLKQIWTLLVLYFIPCIKCIGLELTTMLLIGKTKE